MHVLSMVRQLGGRELSFNNVLDLNSARLLVHEFEVPACAIIKHNNPCGCAAAGSPLEAYERAFACDPLSAFGGVVTVNRAGRQGVRRGARQAVLRGHLRPALHAGGARGPRRQAEHADPRGQRAPPRQRRRARHQARDGRAARAGPRHGPRGPLRDGGRHRAQAVRARVGRDAVRLEGLQARALQRDRAVQGPRHRRHRRRADEPRRLRPPGDREGPHGRHRPRRLSRSPRTPSSRSPTALSSRSTRARRASSSRAARGATPRSSRPRTPPASRWSSPTGATSSTSRASPRGRR